MVHRNPLFCSKPRKSNSTISMVLTFKNFLPQNLSISPQSPSGRRNIGCFHSHLVWDSMDPGSLESEVSMPKKALHVGTISCVDIMDGMVECVSVGEDGKVNLLFVRESELSYQEILDSSGLVLFTAAKWASSSEFATGGYGFSLQWWDQRKPGVVVSQFKGN